MTAEPALETPSNQQAEQQLAASLESRARLVDSYEEKLTTLHLKNESLRQQLAQSESESDFLKEETLDLNKELLELEIALANAIETAKAPVDVKTVYNVVNVPLGRAIDNNVVNPTKNISSYTEHVSSEVSTQLDGVHEDDVYVNDSEYHLSLIHI